MLLFWYVCKGENPEGSREDAKHPKLRRGDPACGVSADTLKVHIYKYKTRGFARAANGRDALPRLPKGNGNAKHPTLRRGDPACGVSADTLKVHHNRGIRTPRRERNRFIGFFFLLRFCPCSCFRRDNREKSSLRAIRSFVRF